MVTIVDYKVYESGSSEEYVRLIVQGNDLSICTTENGTIYAKSLKSSIIASISEEVAKQQVGKQLPGSIVKVETEPWTYVNKETGEEKILNYRYRYNPNREALVPEEEAA